MPTFDIVKTSNPKKTFRVASVMGRFDLQSEKIQERFVGDIALPNEWKVGLIVGKSGTGKTTIAKQLFPDSYITNYKYEAETILDDMPESCSVEEITSAFNSVGFSSPPSWLKRYEVLSNGEKMRVDLSRAILEEKKLFVFDEFTSVVDRNVAQIGSFAMQKAIRKSDKQFIAVTCHYDVEDWLLPDWIFDTDSMTFRTNEGQKKNRPSIEIKIYKVSSSYAWKFFSKYHYLNNKQSPNAKAYIATINNNMVGYISFMNMPHPKAKNLEQVNRLVILPDYQGLGIGIRILNILSQYMAQANKRIIITTSSPSLLNSLKQSKEWICTRFGRNKPHSGDIMKNTRGSTNRITASFEYKTSG
jgi:ABC-type nitrate/sulfonate/bicarbonate transport system ATPase subunit/predicted acetyltransferase